jgi:hypothetical protein
MGLMKFRVPAAPGHDADLKRAYLVGPDRIPMNGTVEVRPGSLVIRRTQNESARLVVPFVAEGFGRPVLSTATLAERLEPYDLTVELARGTLNDVQNQLADWEYMGLDLEPALLQRMKTARHHFAQAATVRSQAGGPDAQATLAVRHALAAGRLLTESYTTQVLQRRKELASLGTTELAIDLPESIRTSPPPDSVVRCITSARLRFAWGTVEPDPGRFAWDVPDAQLQWCTSRKITPSIGPLIELRPHALPDWLWLWQGDFDTIIEQATGLVRAAIQRYRGKISTWHLVHRPASSDILGLSEEEQVRLTARLIQVARQLDPDAHLVVDLDRPWADWMAGGPYQLGPLHLADSLARADIGLSGIGLEIAPGYHSPGSPIRELFEFSRLLDLFALINLPLHVGLAIPSAVAPPTERAGLVPVDAAVWPTPPDESLQRSWGSRWLALALAKPFVRSVTWLEPGDDAPRVFPHAGLLRTDRAAKPLAGWLEGFRRELRKGT